jgi:hypothetical protein
MRAISAARIRNVAATAVVATISVSAVIRAAGIGVYWCRIGYIEAIEVTASAAATTMTTGQDTSRYGKS